MRPSWIPRTRTKIVCTIGPASGTQEVIEQLIAAGMDVARLNFSHGSHEEHRQAVENIRRARDKQGAPIAILQDLQGPRIRVGELGEEPLALQRGQDVVITPDAEPSAPNSIPTTYEQLARDLADGDIVLLDDGRLRLQVTMVMGNQVHCRVLDGGELFSHKGINLPGVTVSSPTLTDKDREDLRLGVELGVDYAALSFVRRPEDVLICQHAIREMGGDIPVIAKLERPEALDNLDAILEVADGVMVARGDLGVEMPLERVPIAQKRIIAAAHEHQVPVITATQMLESMTHSPLPTRAETTDVANAILDGTDAVMLSAETSVGEYPVAAVRMMTRIMQVTETQLLPSPSAGGERAIPRQRSRAVCEAGAITARRLDARLLVAFTRSGSTARRLSKVRPQTPIIAFAPTAEVARRTSLLWGVTPRVLPPVDAFEELITRMETVLLENGQVQPGEVVVFVGATALGAHQTTNTMKVHIVGERQFSSQCAGDEE